MCNSCNTLSVEARTEAVEGRCSPSPISAVDYVKPMLHPHGRGVAHGRGSRLPPAGSGMKQGCGSQHSRFPKAPSWSLRSLFLETFFDTHGGA